MFLKRMILARTFRKIFLVLAFAMCFSVLALPVAAAPLMQTDVGSVDYVAAILDFALAIPALWQEFAMLGIFTIGVPAIVNFSKARGWIADGFAQHAVLVFNVIFFMLFVGAKYFAPTLDISTLDGLVVEAIATILKLIGLALSLWAQFGIAKVAYAGWKKLPNATMVGFSYST